MKKKIIILFLFILMVSPAFAGLIPIKLKGGIKGLAGQEVVLLDGDRKTELARVKSDKDLFRMEANAEVADGRFYFLYVPALGDLGPSMKIPTIYFFIDKPSLEVNAEIVNGNLQLVGVKNSPDMDEYNALNRENRYSKEVETAFARYNEAFELYNMKAQTDENMKLLKEASVNADKVYTSQTEEFVNMIPKHPKSNALMAIIYNNFLSSSPDKLQELLNSFDKSMQSTNYYAKAMLEQINRTKACEVGQLAPDFEVKDLNGNSVKLSSLRGQYVLIDFWASWCGPCRKEIPNLKRVYAEFKDKGLKLVGVSIDDNESKWRKAVEEEKLDYLQLWDSQKSTMKLYNYNGIPFIILISPEGIILEKNLRGTEVHEKVMKYLGSNFKINATLDKPFNGKVYLACIKDRFTRIDSVEVNGKEFSFTGKISKPDVYRIMSRPFGFDVSVIVEPDGEYNVSVLGNRKADIAVVSGKQQQIMNEYASCVKPLEDKYEELTQRYMEVEKKNDAAAKESLMQEMSKAFQEKEQASVNFIKSAPESFASVVIASGLLVYQYEELKDLYNRLDTVNYTDSYYFREFKKKYQEAADKWIQGKAAIDFATTDINGKQVKLSDFKGKYVLLDFWASWCAPCRKKAKELRAVADRLARKNIVMFSVSMDDKREQWEKATKEDNIDWTNTSELKKFKDNKIAADYKVTQLPTLFLLNPDGVIIKQSPTIEELLDMPDVN